MFCLFETSLDLIITATMHTLICIFYGFILSCFMFIYLSLCLYIITAYLNSLELPEWSIDAALAMSSTDHVYWPSTSIHPSDRKTEGGSVFFSGFPADFPRKIRGLDLEFRGNCQLFLIVEII